MIHITDWATYFQSPKCVNSKPETCHFYTQNASVQRKCLSSTQMRQLHINAAVSLPKCVSSTLYVELAHLHSTEAFALNLGFLGAELTLLCVTDTFVLHLCICVELVYRTVQQKCVSSTQMCQFNTNVSVTQKSVISAQMCQFNTNASVQQMN